jgi:hypothetical protein
MVKERKPWFRGAVSLAVLVGVAAALIASPAVSLTSQEKKQVKKIVKKQINKMAPKLNVASAQKLANLTVQRQDFQVADNTANGALAQCPAGQQVIGGGVITGANDAFISNSVPAKQLVGDLNDGETFTAWRGFVVNQIGNSGTIDSAVYAVCAG